MSARGRVTRRGGGRTHRSAPTRGGGGVWEPTGIGAERCLSRRGGTEPAPDGGGGSGGVRGGVWSPRPTGATQVVRSSGPMYLRHGFRRPNFVPKFGASVKSSVPTEGLPESQQRADVGIGPYEKKEIPLQPPGPAAHSGAFAARMGGVGGDRGRDHPRRGQQCRTIPQSACG